MVGVPPSQVWWYTPVNPSAQRLGQEDQDPVLNTSQVLVAHAYNPSYSGSRDQEDLSSQ
jgi:hypothetical protein